MKNVVNLTIDISDKGNISLSLGEFLEENAPTYLYQKPINHYINLFNKSNFSATNELIFCKSFEVYLSYYSNKYLFSNQHGIDKDGGGNSFDGHENSAESLNAYNRPIIHLTDGDIFLNNAEPYKRYARYMDSSIWNYYVPVLIKDEKAIEPGEDGNMRPKLGRYDFTPLDIALEEIMCNYINNRYQLRVAREYAHLFSRIVNQSFLPDISAHGKNVSPYLFHSERKSSEDLKKKEHLDILSEIKQFKWRFLLVDDHSTEKMAVVGGEESTLTKLDIVKTELEKLFKNIEKDNKTIIIATEKDDDDTKKNATIYIECASSIEEAKSKLSRKKYEIILLDYLLGEKGGGREYGYKLLRDIHDIECEIKKNPTKEREIKSEREFDYKKGPDNRFYFMFISAFTTAVSERLLAESWARSEEYWYIGEGACPINTPYLFQYRLLHIMQKRMKDMGLAKFDIKKQEEKKKPFACLIKTIHETFTKEVEEKHNVYTELIKAIYSDKDVRKRANEKFQDVLDLLYHYKSLIRDTHFTENWFDSNESVLVTEFIKSHMAYEGVLEHLTQLVYLTAFGTVRQWPEMWEEYQYIKSVLGKIEEVEIYIVDLKNNSAK